MNKSKQPNEQNKDPKSANIAAAKKNASVQMNVQQAEREIVEDKNNMRNDQEKDVQEDEGLEGRKGKDLLVDPASSVKRV